jgi:hypothetical protein
MIQRASVKPEAARLIAPHFVDGPLQKRISQPLFDEFGHQTELKQLNFLGLAAVQLSKPGRLEIGLKS